MTIVRGILAIVLGLVVGSVVNMGIILLGSKLIPPPAGVDVSDAESIAASMHLFEPRHFVTPFLAHAAGTFAGALVAFLLAARAKPLFAYVIGALFLMGGVAAATMIPAPAWFIGLDLIAAYVPMAWLATVVGARLSGRGG